MVFSEQTGRLMVRKLARPRTFPQHTPPMLPLLRSRPGGVHKTSVVRSPGSDKSRKKAQRPQEKAPLAVLTFVLLCFLWQTLARLFKKLNLCLAMREHPQEAVNQKVRQRVSDYRYNDGK